MYTLVHKHSLRLAQFSRPVGFLCRLLFKFLMYIYEPTANYILLHIKFIKHSIKKQTTNLSKAVMLSVLAKSHD